MLDTRSWASKTTVSAFPDINNTSRSDVYSPTACD